MSTRVPKSKLFPFAVDEEVALRKLFQDASFGIGDLLDVDVSLPEDGDVLVFNDTLGIWENQPQSGGATELSDLTDVDTAGATDGQVLTYDDGTGTWVPATVSGTGTVASVGLALPAQFTISNSPVTTTGTLTAAWANVTARHALLGQTSGDGPPAFRAFTPADITYTTPYTLAGYSDGSTGIEVTLGSGLTMNSAGVLSATGGSGAVTRTITAEFDAGRVNGVDQGLTVGLRSEFRAPYGLEPTAWTLLPKAGSTGNITIEIRTRPFSSGSFAAITDGSPPSISSGARGEASVSTWDSIVDGELIEFEITALSGFVSGITLIVEANEA